MSRRRVDIEAAGPGFITHGHLYGTRAFLVGLSAGPGDEAPTYSALLDRVRRSRLDRVHVSVSNHGILSALDLCHYLAAEAPDLYLTMAFPPGEHAPTEPLIYESVLTVGPGDRFAAADVDQRAGSVSVHHWPGEGVMRMLSEACDAPYGQFLVLSGHDLGHAKVWLAASCDTSWQLIAAHDFETLEPAEAAEMGVPRGQAG